MNKPKWPCVRECQERSGTCHCTCKKHKKYEAEMAEYRKEREAAYFGTPPNDSVYKQIHKNHRRNH